MILWIKELLILIKLIFGKTYFPKDIEILKMRYFPFKGYSYMMWCGKIISRYDSPQISDKSKHHELCHMMQAIHYKYWVQYYIIYVWEWLKGNPITEPYISAYFTNPFEIQVYANENDVLYDYNIYDLKTKYNLKNRKKLFKENGYFWKKYIKTL